MATFYKAYTEAAEEDVIVPASGKKIYIWDTILTSEKDIEVKFAQSNIIVASRPEFNPNPQFNFQPDCMGAADEPLHLKCGDGNSAVKVLYDEV